MSSVLWVDSGQSSHEAGGGVMADETVNCKTTVKQLHVFKTYSHKKMKGLCLSFVMMQEMNQDYFISFSLLSG